MTGEEQLCNAIILQAVKDYRAAARHLKKHPDSFSTRRELNELEQFFLSDWFTVLSDADGEQILIRLRREAGL